MQGSAPIALLLSTVTALTLGACSRQDTPPAASSDALTNLQWQTPLFTGCDSVLAGPICLLSEDTPLHLWLPHASGELKIVGGEVLAQNTVDGGQYLEIMPQRLPGTVTLTPTRSSAPGRARWRFDIASGSAIEPVLSKGRALRMQRDHEQAIDAITPLLDDESHPRNVLAKAYASHWAGQAHLAAGDADGALTLLHRAIEHYARVDRPEALIDGATVALYLHLQRSEFAQAGALLERIRPRGAALDKLGGRGRYLLDYYTGALASHVGDYRNALTHLQRAATTAKRLELHGHQQLAEQWLALQLQAVGRREEADRLLVALSSRSSSQAGSCSRAQLANNIGWNRLLALESRQAAPDPVPPLREALAAYQDPACQRTREQLANARINLSLAYLHAGDLDASARLLNALGDEPDLAPGLALWLHDAQGRVALRRDNPKAALRAYDALAALARRRYDDQAQWRAQAGRAQALETLGELQGALDAYARAEALLALQTVQVPVNAGRETFLTRHRWVTLAYLRLLIDQGQLRQAYAVARAARSRTLRSLRRSDRLAALDEDERAQWQAAMSAYVRARDQLAGEVAEDWMLPADALAPTRAARETLAIDLRRTLDGAFAVLDRLPGPEAGEKRLRPPGATQLLFFSTHEDGTDYARWLAFAESDEGLEATEIACPLKALEDPQGHADLLSACLLEPFASAIDGARQLRLLTSGVLNNLDVHALPWTDAPLLAHVPVSYALDTAASPTRPAALSLPAALVVGDPRGDLPAARQEAHRVATLLTQQRPQPPHVLLGGDANLPSLRAALEQADLFHYAGHAMFGGRGGWDSSLPLAGDTAFTVGDILALRRAPTQVVLSGCETGRAQADADVSQGIGIAHAFLAAGSHSVIAATRPVEDDIANALVTALYERWRPGADVGESLREAQLALARQAPAADWFSFRHITL
ncbi:MAG: CHAT domain-containing protein [Pseudomonadota bacterium]